MTLHALLDRHKWPLVFSGLLPVLLLVPFLGKPFHMDDPLFLWLAQHLQDDPINFFDFNVLWHQTLQPMHEITMNPPGAGYFIAAAASVVGWSEIALHAAFLLPAIAVGLGTYALAVQVCARPLLAVAITVTSPVFLISSTNVMSDTLLLALYVWPVALWIRGMKTQQWYLFFIASLLISIGFVVKYMEITLIPLLLAYTLHRERRLSRNMLSLLIPVAAIVGYHFLNLALIDKSPFVGAAKFATMHSGESGIANSLVELAVGLAFTGGCFAGALFFLPQLFNRKSLGLISIPIVVSLYLFVANRVGSRLLQTDDEFRWGLYLQAVLWISLGIYLLGLAIVSSSRDRSSESLLVSLWFVGIVSFTIYFNWSVNGRTLLPAAPALALLLVRQLKNAERIDRRAYLARRIAPSCAAAVFALFVAHGDYQHAKSNRDAAKILLSAHVDDESTLWFQGHWGFQYYMQEGGASALDAYQSALRPGDTIVIPENSPSIWTLDHRIIRGEDHLLFEGTRWVTTMKQTENAGFYSHFWGPLPFYIGRALPEEFFVYTVRLPE